MSAARVDRVAAHAQVLVDYSANVQAGDTVAIVSSPLGTPLIEALYERVLLHGGFPTAFVSLPRLEEIHLRVANDDQLRRPSFFQQTAMDHFDHIIVAGAPENTRHSASTDPKRQALVADGARQVSQKWLRKIMLPERSITITHHPTAALAQEAAMSLLDYEDFFYRACLLDDDAERNWRDMQTRQSRICEWLSQKSVLRIESPHASLSIRTHGRTWMSDDGHKNFPGGEIFTSPVEDGVDGHIHYTFPAIHSGREVRDVQLWFEAGKVVRAEAGSEWEYLQKMLDLDEGARRLGEVAIGTNYGVPRTTGDTLLDEKIGGSCHCALGAGFANLGSTNESALHWDMVSDLRVESTIAADGEVFYRNGEFVLP